ncbi:MAG TPA: hypothetical protein VFC60_00515 [Tissierellaceae bacterium]|nr:hypothetical protein [Tissierellaceae bacterium]
MRKFTYLFFVILLILSLSLFGCTKDEGEEPNNTDDPIGVEDENEEDDTKTSEDIINEFGEIIADNEETEDLIKFIDNNIEKVTSIEGDQMVIELINRLEESKDDLTDKLLDKGEIMTVSSQRYFPEENVKDIEDKELRELVEEIIANKYKLQMAEGMYYPIVDYEKLKEYDDYVSEEIKDYVHLKAVDSNTVIASDAALVISHNELADIIIDTEEYLEKYAGGVYHEEVETMYNNKLDIYLSGLPNTLIYDYNTNKINEDVLESYIETGSKGDTVTSFIVGKYINIIRDNENIIDDEVLKKADELVEEALTLLVNAK